jgi:hypothetical protein
MIIHSKSYKNYGEVKILRNDQQMINNKTPDFVKNGHNFLFIVLKRMILENVSKRKET